MTSPLQPTAWPRPLAAVALALACSLALVACGNNSSPSPLLRAEPAVDSTQIRVPRTLRLYFSALPDVERSTLRLEGPAGEYRLRGLHTMAADDLMIEILDPLAAGDYTVRWSTVLAGDEAVHAGSYGFSVRRSGEAGTGSGGTRNE